ncbi:MAG TPA: TetR/AcrR family transcriptional regulator [Nocardioides sp.]|nr:TetR/AcrR family transcriptional regulator [Nocardioides sp.]
MARYSSEHKQATRQRMIETAARRLKSDGIDGSGIATLVADAGLTNGAFYGHFASKDDLVATVIGQQLGEQAARIDAEPAGLESLEAFVRAYLSPEHRTDRSGGCPSAALLDEVGRRDDATREAYTTGARALIHAIARHLDAAEVGDPLLTTQRAIGLYTLLVGSLQLARAVNDPELSDQILAAAYANALTLAGARPGPATPTHQESS